MIRRYVARCERPHFELWRHVGGPGERMTYNHAGGRRCSLAAIEDNGRRVWHVLEAGRGDAGAAELLELATVLALSGLGLLLGWWWFA